MRNILVEKWEAKLQEIFNQIDQDLEDVYGDRFPLAPNRPPRGQSPTPEGDGLFDLAVTFSAGIGSPLGPGYVFRVRMATPARVPPELVAEVEGEVLARLRVALPIAFPGRDLRVERDGNQFRIFGDLSLS